jgi:hypothetical protein
MNIRYFISDDVRQEINGKTSLAGLYADNIIVLNNENTDGSTQSITKETPLAIDRLSFLINVSDIVGSLEFEFQIIDPTGNPHNEKATIGKIELAKGMSFNVIVHAAPFTFHIPGIYKLRLYVNGEAHDLSFEIRINENAKPATT